MKSPRKIALLGTVGVPGCYGGFETLAENLVRFHAERERVEELTVWCSSAASEDRPATFETARLRYVSLSANGIQSIPYDALSLLDAVRTRHDRILLLGVSGALMLPLIRLISKVRILTNIDGIEWKRAKWNAAARAFLRVSEWAAVRFSHAVIADNEGIADHVRETYGSDCHVIAYGGDHAVANVNSTPLPNGLPRHFALALCRIEPENNVEMILDAYSKLSDRLVFVGNWNNSSYGMELRNRFGDCPNLHLLDPIYDPGALKALRSQASFYVHGHSAGGTNPSLVEMMHFGIPVFAHGCVFNRYTTEEKARYFETAEDLCSLVQGLSPDDASEIGSAMKEIALRRYTWGRIGEAYFDLLERA